MHRISVLIPILFLAITFPATAQVLNVEQVRADSDTTGWVGELGFDLSLNKFNDRVLKTGGEANASYFSHLHQYILLTQLDIVTVDGNPLVSDGYSHLRATLLRKKPLSPELFTQYQYNNNLDLKNRALAGAGVRYNFLNGESISGSFSTGLMAEYEEWELSDTETVENTFLKSTSNLVIRGQLNPQASLTLIGYYQARPDRFFEPRVTSENRLTLRISERLSFRVNFTLMYDTDPVIDVPNLTYELKNGLVFTL
ncbi:DUF481 domain-containing protein [Rhodohalobacter mucosus]|uniref:DUF481 domain-containing protein n=1 Tax=Rhodohalobacter mucosus TaxID=2079485 RepID=A0A316TZ82_9BACT|nr:DUF481 domain-containing protein [Rhodohalobacter mucosus]PWN08234.1 hypothetical protein DDZ15_00965 [Rhodohalobacter mucosus]